MWLLEGDTLDRRLNLVARSEGFRPCSLREAGPPQEMSSDPRFQLECDPGVCAAPDIGDTCRTFFPSAWTQSDGGFGCSSADQQRERECVCVCVLGLGYTSFLLRPLLIVHKLSPSELLPQAFVFIGNFSFKYLPGFLSNHFIFGHSGCS